MSNIPKPSGRFESKTISSPSLRTYGRTSLNAQAGSELCWAKIDAEIDVGVGRTDIGKEPDNAQAQILLGEAYVAKGMPAEGVAEMQKGVALDSSLAKTPERWDRYPLLAYAYAAAGRRDEALKILVEQQRLAKRGFVSPYNFAIIYTGLGDKDQAFEWLTKCVEQRTMILVHLKSRPLFDPLRSDPRYAELLRSMNLEP